MIFFLLYVFAKFNCVMNKTLIKGLRYLIDTVLDFEFDFFELTVKKARKKTKLLIICNLHVKDEKIKVL